MMQVLRSAVLLLSVMTAIFAWAEAPVVDLNDGSQSNTAVNNSWTPTPATSASVAPAIAPDSSGTPVMAAASTPVDNTPSQPLTTEQRLTRLEQQMNNITQMNTPARIEELQQQVAQLQGQLEVQTHDLKMLSDAQKNYYQDLDQRLKQNQASSATPATAAKPTAATAVNSDEQTLYQNAITALTAKKYDEAAEKLQAYLKKYPQGQYIANAHYWLGEVYFMQKKTDLAAAQFQVVINQYPKDTKVSDAMLKLAFIHDLAGKRSQAKQELQQVVKTYPNTTAAQLATMRLKTMQN